MGLERRNTKQDKVRDVCEYLVDGAWSAPNEFITTIVQMLNRHGGREAGLDGESEYIGALKLGMQLRTFISEHMDTKVLGKLQGPVLKHLDDILRQVMWEWARSLIPRLMPRPGSLFHLVSFEDYLQFYFEWIASRPAQCAVPQIDSITLIGWGQCLTTIVEQMSDYLQASSSAALDVFYILHDRKRLFKALTVPLAQVGAKLRKQHGCMRIMRQLTAIMSTMVVKSEESYKRLLNFLLTDSKLRFEEEASENGLLKFVTKSLKDPKKRSLFDALECDGSSYFDQDYIVQLEKWSPGGAKAIIASRNSWSKDQLISKFSAVAGVELIQRCCAVNADLDFWIQESFRCFEVASLSLCWTLQKLESEGIRDVDAMLSLKCYNFVCSFMLDHLGTSQGIHSKLTRLLWRQCYVQCANWLKFLASLDKTTFQLKLTNALNYLNKLLNVCPAIASLERESLVDALAKVQTSLLEASPTPSFLEEHTSLSMSRLSETKQNLNIPSRSLKFARILGNGTFGDVYKCFDYDLNLLVAIKEVRLPSDQARAKKLIDEVDYLTFMRHRHIVELLGVTRVDDCLYIKTEFCEGLSLQDYIKLQGRASDQEFRSLALQMALGLSHLHGNHIIHGDLKPGNILIDQYGTLKLADFGAAQRSPSDEQFDKPEFSTGTVPYMAPETMRGTSQSLASDVWSLGCTLFFLACGSPPWAELDGQWCVLIALASGRMFDMSPLAESNIALEGQEIIKLCLRPNPADRPEAKALLLRRYLFEPKDEVDPSVYL